MVTMRLQLLVLLLLVGVVLVDLVVRVVVVLLLLLLLGWDEGWLHFFVQGAVEVVVRRYDDWKLPAPRVSDVVRVTCVVAVVAMVGVVQWELLHIPVLVWLRHSILIRARALAIATAPHAVIT